MTAKKAAAKKADAAKIAAGTDTVGQEVPVPAATPGMRQLNARGDAVRRHA